MDGGGQVLDYAGRALPGSDQWETVSKISSAVEELSDVCGEGRDGWRGRCWATRGGRCRLDACGGKGVDASNVRSRVTMSVDKNLTKEPPYALLPVSGKLHQ